MNIWDYQQKITRGLLLWSGLSIAFGTLFYFTRKDFWKGVGLQFIGWGLVDAAIGIIGMNSAKNRKTQSENSPAGNHVEIEEKKKLIRLLRINSIADVFYVLGGAYLYKIKGSTSKLWSGQSLGIMIQGFFLLIFDLYHSLILGRQDLTKKHSNLETD